MKRPVLLLLLAVNLSWGQAVIRPNSQVLTQPNGLPQQPEYTGPKGSISGTVVDAITGAPIRKAQVSSNGTVAITDASGSFTFDQLPPGNYGINAQHPSYPPTPMATQFTQATLAPGEQKRGLELKLTPSASISGRVTDEDGDPLPNCNVNAMPRNPRMGPQGSANTRRDGTYTMLNLPAGKYYLGAHCQAPLLQPRPFAPPNAVLPGPQLGYITLYYPGTTNFSGAQRITAIAGQELRGHDFHIAAQKVSTVIVHLTGMETKGRNRIMVSLTPDDGGPARPMDARTGTTQPQTGIAAIQNVPPGKYILRVQALGPERSIVARQPVDVGEESREITVQVTPPVAVPGTLVLDPQAPAESKPTRLWLSQEDEQGVQSQAELKPDGSFVFPFLTPGKYHVAFDRGTFVQTVSVGTETFTGPEFELKPGSAGPVQITLSSATGTISGEVQGGSADTQIHVFVTQLGQPGIQQTQSLSNAGEPRKYSLTIGPGKYRLYAVEGRSQGSFYTFLNNDAIVALAETVELRAGNETVHNLKLITASDLEKADQ